MSTTTATFGQAASTAEATSGKSLFQRFIELRERQGAARVREVFARMSDAQLKDIGFTVDQVRHVRTTGSVPATWF